MFVPLTLEDYQRDIDDGWVEYCNDKIAHWYKLKCRAGSVDGKDFCEGQIIHFKRMRGLR